MNAKGKKFIALFIVFSLLALSSNLMAKERRGATLVIQKKDGQQVNGELIAVKQTSLLLKDSESGADVSVDISDIKVIKIVKKSKAGLGAGLGLLIGAGGMALVGGSTCGHAFCGQCAAIGALIGAAPGLLIGGLIGVGVGVDKEIQIEGKSDSEINKALEELRKKARVPDYQ